MSKKEFNPEEWIDTPQATSNAAASPRPLPDAGKQAEDIKTVVARIEESGTDITPGYKNWCNLGFAISDAMGEAGRELYHRICRFNSTYNEALCDEQYTKCLKGKGSGVTVRSFFYKAKQAGINIKTSAPSKPAIPSPEGTAGNEDSEGMADGSDAEESLPTFSDKLAGPLPGFLQKVVEVADSIEDADLLLIGAITTLSSCLPGISGVYDQRVVFANLYLFVTANASAGKGHLSLCRNLIDPIDQDIQHKNDLEFEDYRQKLNDYNAARNKQGLEKPIAPPLRMLIIPANSSSTATYQTLWANEGSGILFETEGDSLTNTLSKDYGDYSDGLRKAYHHENIGYVRRKDNEKVKIPHPRLSAVLSGTKQQVKSLIISAENGLFSRFLFYHIPLQLVWKDVFAQRMDKPLDDYFQKLGTEFFEFYTLLKSSSPVVFRTTSEQNAKFNAFFEEAQLYYAAFFGEDLIPSVRRMGLATFRIAMVLTSLRIMEDGAFGSDLECLDVDFDNALLIAQVLLEHMRYVYSALLRPSTPSAQFAGGGTQNKQDFWNALPDNFDTKSFVRLAESFGINQKTAERYIKSWCDAGTLIHASHGHYSKSNRTITKTVNQ